MSDYTKTYDGAAKDAANSTILGSDFDSEFTLISTAIASKIDQTATGAVDASGGDTAAGDAAAVGYTATEGVILAGQGSTNDVTLKNDADTNVLTIPTGTTNVKLANSLYFAEQAAADADTAGEGQSWVRNDTPCLRMFTDDAGTDHIVNTTLSSEIATTSGDSQDFTVPAGVKRIKMLVEGVSLDDNGQIGVRLGDSGGVETTGYTSQVLEVVTTTPGIGIFTTEFSITDSLAGTSTISGVVNLYLKDAANNTWMYDSTIIHSTGANFNVGTGYKSLSGELTTVRIFSPNGHIFDAGSVAIQYD